MGWAAGSRETGASRRNAGSGGHAVPGPVAGSNKFGAGQGAGPGTAEENGMAARVGVDLPVPVPLVDKAGVEEAPHAQPAADMEPVRFVGGRRAVKEQHDATEAAALRVQGRTSMASPSAPNLKLPIPALARVTGTVGDCARRDRPLSGSSTRKETSTPEPARNHALRAFKCRRIPVHFRWNLYAVKYGFGKSLAGQKTAPSGMENGTLHGRKMPIERTRSTFPD